MKKISFLRHYLVLFIIVLISNNEQVFCQDKINILAGAGLPELLNVGLNIQNNQTQLGIRIGSWPTDEKIISISGDIYYHFAGISRLSPRRLWYVKFGLNYLRDETEIVIDKYIYLNSRIGRDLNISKKIGIAIDAGLIIRLSHQESVKKPEDFWDIWDIGPELSVIPSIGIAMFYKI